jgi:S1-C subfamily serine protease
VALAGCASSPAEQAAGTSGARVAAQSLTSIRAHDTTVGAGVAISDGVVLTNAHVVRQGGSRLTLRSADGLREAPADIISIDQRQDFALLQVRQGFLEPAPVAARRPQRGEAVWALGPEGLGRAVAMGPVTRSDATLPGFGRGFTARLGALMGFSGGPVVNQGGEVIGLTTARLGTSGAGLLGSLTGIDVAGLANSMGREVFILHLPPEDYASLR